MSQHVTLQASDLQVQSTFVRRLLEHEQLGFDVLFLVQINTHRIHVCYIW
jgi:hypothetical protein